MIFPVEEKEMTLYYRKGDGSEKINTFTPVFPELEELKDEVQIILDEFSDDEKYLMMSEGRTKTMRWIVLCPKN